MYIKKKKKTQIRYMANSSSYSKGAELYATGKVLDMDVKNMSAFDEIVASVKGSGRNIYEGSSAPKPHWSVTPWILA